MILNFMLSNVELIGALIATFLLIFSNIEKITLMLCRARAGQRYPLFVVCRKTFDKISIPVHFSTVLTLREALTACKTTPVVLIRNDETIPKLTSYRIVPHESHGRRDVVYGSKLWNHLMMHYDIRSTMIGIK